VIVRFQPFVETGEFANAGIVLIAPRHRVFMYRLQNKRFKRYTDFFENVTREQFKAHTDSLQNELKSFRKLLMGWGFDRRFKDNDSSRAAKYFEDFARPRDGFIEFSEIRTILTDDPKKACDRLYSYYVEREFVRKHNRDQVLENHVQYVLKKEGLLENYRYDEVGDQVFHARFPFVQFDVTKPVSIIKPLGLDLESPSKIIDRGGHWVYRMRELKRRNVLPESVLFTLERPKLTSQDTRLSVENDKETAYRHIQSQLKNLELVVTEYGDDDQLVEFAESNSQRYL